MVESEQVRINGTHAIADHKFSILLVRFLTLEFALLLVTIISLYRCVNERNS